MRVAIHQPNFFPWLGIFHRAAMVDRFVFFDHVQALRGKSWLTRNRLLVHGEARWLTMPTVKSGAGLPSVNQVRIQWDNPLSAKHLRTFELAYGRAPHFDEVYPFLSDLYAARPRLISEFNTRFFTHVVTRLGLDVDLVSSSTLVAEHPELERLRGNDLVVVTCVAAGATHYVSGDGCHDFIDPRTFEREGISFAFQQYEPEPYPQHGSTSFVSHLSALDVLFNLGFDGFGRLLESVSQREARVAAE